MSFVVVSRWDNSWSDIEVTKNVTMYQVQQYHLAKAHPNYNIVKKEKWDGFWAYMLVFIPY